MTTLLPKGTSIVQVYIISPNRVLGVPASAFLRPEIKGTTYNDTPCLAFLVEHRDESDKTTRLLFDLGIRKDWQNSPPAVVEAIQKMDIQITTQKDTIDILEEHGIEAASIDAVILSHWHFDHAGDLNRLSRSTSIIVGPGFTTNLLPGYPTDPDSLIDGTGFQTHEVKQMSFDGHLQIADMKAIDWFGDGSFYILDTPGHAIGHISALARASKSVDSIRQGDTFIFLAGDVCHHAGELRPSTSVELPPCHKHYIDVHPTKCTHAPFYTASQGGFNLDANEMQLTVEKVQKLDASSDVLVLLAHDNWLLHVVDLFPSAANEWKSKGWGEKAKWRFLQDFVK